ncbi:DUF2330 domain-containing protein [Pararoseomonas sp. SCSIO 73927]|uniref:DUF2330 domain-containing protein n=1 Tax=Pararoseomonas sp. SCSIO 73927 TaxID=3114537 RepID=UPI0030CBF786
MTKKIRVLPVALAALLFVSQTAQAFCGFYVATSSEPLVNRASRVVLAREGNRTSITMASDVSGDPKEFAMVVPVPTVIRREQVSIVRPDTVQHLVDYTKPRIVEYFDEDPCPEPEPERRYSMAVPAPAPAAAPATVRVEAQFAVEEYDIVVLSATDSGDLIRYLNRNGYKIPPGAEETVNSYLGQDMKFFVAKVNLNRMRNNTSGFLRPIRVDYESPKFMLPIRLGTVNATGPQEMVVLTLTRRGRVETTNYRTQRMPTDIEVPVFAQEEFGRLYDAAFDRAHEQAGRNAVFLEYAWNMGACDPCAAPNLSNAELRELGATWVPEQGWQQNAFVTRLHVRYDREHFPEDLAFQETVDNRTYQVRLVTRHAYRGDTSVCRAGRAYEAGLQARYAQWASNLERLTGWSGAVVRHRMAGTGQGLR